MKNLTLIIFLFGFLELQISFAQEVPSESQQSNTSSNVKISKGFLPSDDNYWSFNNWYKNQAIVNLIVSGENVNNVTDCVREIAKLAAKDVMIGKIILIGGSSSSQLQIYKNPAAELNIHNAYTEYASKFAKSKSRAPSIQEFNMQNLKFGNSFELQNLAKDLGIDNYVSSTKAVEIIDNLKIENSPTWVVKHKGKNYIYEGYDSISRLFSKSGQFLEGNSFDNQSHDVFSTGNEF